MFRIPKEQLAILAEKSLESFIKRACDFLRSTTPKRWADKSDAELHAWTDASVRHALSMGLHQEDSILRYLEVASDYGKEFAERADVLNMIADPFFLGDWAYARQILNAQVGTK